MKLSSYTVDYQSLESGVSEFDFPVTKELFELWHESEIVNGSGMIHATINKNGSLAQMHTDIEAIVEMECDRCLDLMDMKVKWSGDCVIKVGDEAGEYDGEILWIGTRENILDLVHYFYESIMLGLPICRTHQRIEDCNQAVVKFLSKE